MPRSPIKIHCQHFNNSNWLFYSLLSSSLRVVDERKIYKFNVYQRKGVEIIHSIPKLRIVIVRALGRQLDVSPPKDRNIIYGLITELMTIIFDHNNSGRLLYSGCCDLLFVVSNILTKSLPMLLE